jgi:hypothetical protein
MRCSLLFPVMLAVCLAAEDGPTVVKNDSAEVHAAMSASSPVVKTLRRGDVVTIELSLSAADGAWCNIGIAGRSNLGWLRCDALSTATLNSEGRWQRVENAQPQPASPTQSSDSPLVVRAKKSCPDFDYSQLKQGWPLPQVAPNLELERCLSDGPGKRLSRSEIRYWQAEAERTGAQACWQRYLAIREKYNADDLGVQDRALAVNREWNQDRCSNRVEALRLRMLAGPLYDKLPQIYDDVMSGRQPTLP